MNMELILISDSKLKIMLSRQDMEYYELCNEEIDYDSTETRRAFWQILDEAKHKTGFDAAEEKVFIQLYPSKEGGCEMYVTKVGVIPSLAAELSGRKAEVRVGRVGHYRFRKQEDLLKVCRILLANRYHGESSAYFLDDGTYALLIHEVGRSSLGYAGAPDTYSFIEEFGERIRGQEKTVYLKEHGTCLCQTDAVNTLGKL